MSGDSVPLHFGINTPIGNILKFDIRHVEVCPTLAVATAKSFAVCHSGTNISVA